MSGDLGPAAAGLLGAILMVLPGLVTGACGVLLQILPVQKIFGQTAAKLVQARQ